MTISVVLAEDYEFMRDGLRQTIESDSGLQLLAVCADYDSLLSALKSSPPDVLLTDIRMPPTGTDEGIRAGEYLRSTNRRAGVVVLSNYDDPAYVLAFLRKGTASRAYLLKERWGDREHVLAAIRAVAAGDSIIDPKVVDVLLKAQSRLRDSPLLSLAPREWDVLREMAQGKNNAAIAASLRIGVRAVESYINTLFGKLGLAEDDDIHRRVKAVLLFLATQDASATE